MHSASGNKKARRFCGRLFLSLSILAIQAVIIGQFPHSFFCLECAGWKIFWSLGLDNDSCGKDGSEAQEAGNQRGKFMDFSKAMKQGSEGIGSKRGSAVFTRTA